MKTSHAPAHPASGGPTRGAGWGTALTGRLAVAVVLGVFWVVMEAALSSKSLTVDEVAHVASGYSYWHFSDYRLQPENGQLPQRVAGLPMALGMVPPPAPDPANWHDAEQWKLGYQWLYGPGRDAGAPSSEGRMLCGLFAVALGWIVWAWTRRLFGPVAAMLSLLLYVLNPTILANGALMTSDMAAALFMAASTWCMALLLERFTLGRLVLSGLVLGALFLSKTSAFLAVPLAMVLVAGRLVCNRPLPFSVAGYRCEITSRSRQLLAFAFAAIVHAVLGVGLIWASYGFRYSAFADSGAEAGRFRIPWEYLLHKPDLDKSLASLNVDAERSSRIAAILTVHGVPHGPWANASLDAMADIRRDVLTPDEGRRLDAALAAPPTETWVRLIETARRCHLLPEAWIYGFTDVYRRSQVRPSFLNGEFRMRGWPYFFPYSFLVKTPLALFGIAGLALAAVRWRKHASGWRTAWDYFYPTLPLWSLFGLYWAAAIVSHLNIGHRHVLPVYAPMFILCGISARWLAPSEGGAIAGWRRTPLVVLIVLLACLAVETAWCFPNYLAYFNGIVAPREAYRHLVDSSLDWGQDLPAARSFLDHEKGGQPAYFSYFGTASPRYYGISALPLYSIGIDEERPPDWKNIFLSPGEVESALPKLRGEWADFDLLGTQRLGDSVVVVFLRKPASLDLRGGTYLVSATMLQPVYYPFTGPWGPWNERYEAAYQELSEAVQPLMDQDGTTRIAALRRHSAGEWPDILKHFEEYRFARLTAFLRARQPDEEINFSILVYRLSDADVELALRGPHPAFGPDAKASETRLLPTFDDLPGY